MLAKLGKDSQELLDSAVTRVNINELFGKLGARELESDVGTSHRLVHLKPVGEAADGVDAALGRSKALVNFTINNGHELKLHHATRVGEGAAPVADALGAPEITFYWALPSSRYDVVRRRRTPFPVTGLVRGALGAAERSRVKQYALRVPLGSRR